MLDVQSQALETRRKALEADRLALDLAALPGQLWTSAKQQFQE
jgi:hypothetical protein